MSISHYEPDEPTTYADEPASAQDSPQDVAAAPSVAIEERGQ